MTIEITPGTIQVRAIFTDKRGNYSKNYKKQSIDIGDEGGFTLYGVTDDDNPDLRYNAIFEIDPTDASVELTHAFTEEFIDEDNGAIAYASDDNLIYRMIDRETREDEGIIFESIHPTTKIVTNIPLQNTVIDEATYEWKNSFGSPNGLTYIGSGIFFFIDGTDYFYRVSKTGVVERLAAVGPYHNGIAWTGTQLYTLNQSERYISIINTTTGVISEENTALSLTNYNIGWARTMTYHPGLSKFVAILDIEPIDAEMDGAISGEALCTFDTDGVASIIGACIAFDSLAYVTTTSTLLGCIENADPDDGVEDHSISPISMSTGAIGELFLNTSIYPEEQYSPTIACKPNDNFIYRLYEIYDEEENSFLVFEKLNLSTLNATNIALSGVVPVDGITHTTSGYISDGGYDMYDSGNLIFTNTFSVQGFAPYTHSRGVDSSEASTSVVENGTNWFGSGSTYFTNRYPGLFILVAKNISITEFSIGGELGADGSGDTNKAIYNLNGGFKGYFKKVYNSGDPSVNHLIILPPNENSIVHTASLNTDNDEHKIAGLNGIDSIYYLLFSKDSGGEVTEEEATAIGNEFLSVISGASSTADVLSNLDENYSEITNHISGSIYQFSDDTYGDNEFTIGQIDGLYNPDAITYWEDGIFLVIANETFYQLTDTGVATQINDGGFVYDSVTGMAFIGDRLFAVNSFINSLIEFDPETGAILSETEDDKKGPSVICDGLSITSFYGLASQSTILYAIAYDSNSDSLHLISIPDVTPNDDNEIVAYDINEINQFKNIAILTN